ncbi:heat shock transcription factor, X-linked member 3-like [Dipodomys merriami]|uniref:heat shock transcription factor, X-linked member 3-like n=1 Tax=Dipodomys merriami TaxID=94247 RepID=UPI003855B64A
MDKIMQDENMQEDLEEKLVPPVVDKPPGGGVSEPFPNPTMDSRDSMDEQGNQAIIQEMPTQSNLESSENTPNEANKEDNIDAHLSFPRKLWLIAENQAFKSVTWNEEGDHVIIHAEQFQKEVLDLEGTNKVFHASTMKSFIRLLNLHEFTKIRPNNSTVQAQEQGKVMIYHNSNFRRDNPDLVKNICIKRNNRHIGLQETHKTSLVKESKEKAKTAGFQLDAEHEVNRDPQRECLSEAGSREDIALYFRGIPPRNTCPQEPKNSSGEGTSAKNLFELLPDCETKGSEDVPSTSQSVPDMRYMMDLYNICCSFLLGSLLFITPDEPLDGDKDPEDEQ